MTTRAVVLGGGLSGCVMAYLLRKEGYEVTIIEKDSRLGGLCKTFQEDGNKYEFGPHIFHSDKPKIIHFVRHLCTLKETRFKVKSCPYGDIERLFQYPLTVSNILRLEEPGDAIWDLYNLVPGKLDCSSFESYVVSMMGSTLYNIFIRNYTVKQWGIEPAKMSAKWAPKRMFFTKDDDVPFHSMWSAYPPAGYDSLFYNLTAGVRVIRGFFQSMIAGERTVKEVVIANGERIAGDLFFSSLPIDDLFGSCGRLDYRGIYKSYIRLKRSRLLDGLWYTFPNHHDFTRIVEYKNYNFDSNDTTILSAAFPFDSEELDSLPVEEYDRQFRSVLKELFHVVDADILSQFGMKDAYSYPVITDDNETKFEMLLNRLTEFDNVFTIGRLGLFCYIPMSICISQCCKLVEMIAGYRSMSKEERMRRYHEIR